MNFLKKIKGFFESKKINQNNFRKELCDTVMSRIEFKIANLQDRPKNLTEKEWRQILNKILFAFSVKQRSITLKSLAKTRMRKKKTEEGFRLFEVYFNDL